MSVLFSVVCVDRKGVPITALLLVILLALSSNHLFVSAGDAKEGMLNLEVAIDNERNLAAKATKSPSTTTTKAAKTAKAAKTLSPTFSPTLSPSENPSASPSLQVCSSDALVNLYELDAQRFALAMLYCSLTAESQSTLYDWMGASTDECTWTKVYCKTGVDADVVSMDLGNLQLEGTLPTELQELTAMTTLSLMNNPLLVANNLQALAGLDALTTLILDNNALESFPTEFGEFNALTYLKAYDNNLQILPSEIGNLNLLRTLMLFQNQLTRLPTELGKLDQLKELQLHSNQLSSLPSELGNLSSLTSLLVNGNSLVTPLPSELCALSSQILYFTADCGTMSACCT